VLVASTLAQGSEWGICSWDVRMYICIRMCRSCLECQFALMLRDSGITDTRITRGCWWRTELGKEGNDISWQWRMGRTVWPGLHNVCIWQSQAKKSVHPCDSSSIFNCILYCSLGSY